MATKNIAPNNCPFMLFSMGRYLASAENSALWDLPEREVTVFHIFVPLNQA